MDALEQLKAEVTECTRCALSQKRTNVVFGEGSPNAKIMCIGEGPGYYEDQMGRPFVGKSGELLDKILGVCGFNRTEHVYIANIVKCRPPENRDPLPEERTTCLPYLLKQIEIIQPTILVLLGATALKGLIDPSAKITQVRGTWLIWNGYKVMPTFHPSALLRNEQLKRPAWEDFKKVVTKYRELVNSNHFSAHC
ncbi:MAG: uracil-DNA glycosylase [Bacteroidetes bacterium GWF2_33_16]|nr:MAG: uracil-DNA glycosylase [Bacteroidetes bacterium GWE2_32_14]OFY07701.1 MAG: uracil-DNA glycosylase [Bacteroidetes bacterium GWF2_33_16]